jgi:hypothetical protein
VPAPAPPLAAPEPLPDRARTTPRRTTDPGRASGDGDSTPRAEGTTIGTVGVLAAAVCSAFDKRGSPDWQCTAVNGSSSPGTFTFYTRVRAPSETTIEHRWYRNNRLHQTSRLRVRPGGTSGYRTFSRVTVGAGRAGDWSVELRAADGTLLRELHFAVR